MDNYKKKSAKFSGLGRNIRAAELDAARRSSRLQRFSLLRPIDDDVPIEEPKEKPTSQIPIFSNQKPQSRLEMLKKWKNEKVLKKQAELQAKKPPFKVGHIPLKSEPSTTSFNKHNRFGELSRNQGIDNKSVTVRSQASNIRQATKTKIEIIKPQVQRYNSVAKPQVVTKKAGSVISSNTKLSKVTTGDANGNKKISPNAVTKPIQKPAVPSLLPPQKQQVSNTKPKGPSLASQSNAQASTRPKGPAFGFRPNSQTSTAKPLENRPNLLKQPSKFNNPAIKGNPAIKSAKPVEVKQPVPVFRKPALKSIPTKVQPKKAKDPESETRKARSPCQTEAEKSFAPKGFIFCPPTGLEASFLMDEDGPCSIFAKVKNEMEGKIRTSTPKKFEWGDVKDIQNCSYDMKPSFTVESTILTTSVSACTNTLPLDVKNTDCLQDNDTSEVKLSVPTCLQRGVLEQAHKNVPLGEICPEITSEIKQSETLPLEKMHLEHSSFKTDMLDPKQSCVALSKDYQILPSEMDPEQAKLCKEASAEISLPVSNETKELASCIPKDVANKTADLEIDQEKIKSDTFLLEKEPEKNSASEICVLGVDGVKHSISELSLSEKKTACPLTEKDTLVLCQKEQSKNNSGPCLPEMEQATGASGDSMDVFQKPEKDEKTPLDTIFLPSLSFLHGTEKTKRFTRSHRRMEPSLLQISESPEIDDTPKSLRKKGNPDFTPRRSRRLARLSAFNSVENLFDTTTPSFSSPGMESSALSYDFENLHLESVKDATEEPSSRMSTRSSSAHNRKVSLLYTPPRTRKSVKNKLTNEDLMTFSPNV